MRVEKAMLEHFFEFCTEDSSFVSLRRKLRQDLEVLGNAYVEVLRNGAGEPAGFVYVPGFTMRLLPLDRVLTDVIVQQRVSSIALKPVKRKKQLRKLVQVFEAFTVYFKEFGDPRIISKRTGRVFETEAELIDADKDDSPATEVLHFKVHSSRTAYGVPRWIGNLLSVLGSRQAEEVNYLYFENKSIPPMAILVNGGRISDGTEKRIEDYIGSEIKGKKNFHKILIIEAVGDGGSTLENPGKTRIEFKQLTDAQNKDALFQNYDERNIDKVGMSFRLPRMLRGDIRDFNRASAEAALEFAEQQVFQPEREEFDFIINRRILPAIGVRYWRFASNSPTVNDPKELATMVKDLVLANVIVPAEAREICEDIFNKEFPAIDAAWTKQPVPLTLAGISPTDATSTPWSGEDDPLIPHTPYSEQAEQKAGEPPRITATALGHVVTVNEAREAYGLSPKTLADGSPDPAGNITIGEHLERVKQQHLQQYGPGARAKDIGGGDMGDSIAGAPMPQIADGGTLTIHDLQTQGGLLGLHQGQRRFRRLPPRSASSNTPAGAAKQLLAIRDALLDAEATTAAHEFYREKRAELEGRIPREAIAAAVPVETVADAADKK